MPPLTASTISKLSDYITDDFPLGPIDARAIDNKEIYKYFFDKENLIYSKITKRPSIIVGRRGSGKTAFLLSLKYGDRFDYSIELTTYKAFADILASIHEVEQGDKMIFPDAIADLWDILFWSALFTKLIHVSRSHSKKLAPIWFYVEEMGLKPALTPEEVMKTLLSTLAERGGNTIAGMLASATLKMTERSASDFNSAMLSASEFLKGEKKSAVLLLDSFDEYVYHLDHEQFRLALAGLLKCVGRFNISRTRYQIRVCVPAELYFEFQGVSSHRIKDFSHQLLLHWHAGEVISIAAFRLRMMFEMYYPDILLQLRDLDIQERKDAIAFIERILPEKLVNNLGIEEGSLEYILRHTQLLPRQFLRYFTQILRISHAQGNPLNEIRADVITEAVSVVEADIWKEICEAYQYRYPDAIAVCEKVIPELPLVFSDGVLHAVFNHYGKKYFHSGEGDYNSFVRMMVEIGAIGKVIRQKWGMNGRYTVGEFEYTSPDRLAYSRSDQFCIHPVFSGTNSPQGANRSTDTLIYPLGTDPRAKYRRELS